ncbi:DUF2069 domain-containing protein [Ottowia sp.]|uniref:DUF2069 domain-containing protein n=1 Tax=Ottowia sp. TaxID=1898956 RepID=UPI003A85D4D1
MPQHHLPALATAAASATPSPAVQATRAVAALSLLVLAALCLAWELWLAPLRPGGSWLALKALPLLLPLPGLLRYRMLTYRRVALFIWLYFVEGVVRAADDPGLSSRLAGVQVALVLVLFAACAVHVRLRQKQAQRMQPPTTDPAPGTAE